MIFSISLPGVTWYYTSAFWNENLAVVVKGHSNSLQNSHAKAFCYSSNCPETVLVLRCGSAQLEKLC